MGQTLRLSALSLQRAEFRDQARQFLRRRQRLEAVNRGRGRPWQLFAGVDFQERPERPGIVQHRGPHRDKSQASGDSIEPAHAIRGRQSYTDPDFATAP